MNRLHILSEEISFKSFDIRHQHQTSLHKKNLQTLLNKTYFTIKKGLWRPFFENLECLKETRQREREENDEQKHIRNRKVAHRTIKKLYTPSIEICFRLSIREIEYFVCEACDMNILLCENVIFMTFWCGMWNSITIKNTKNDEHFS